MSPTYFGPDSVQGGGERFAEELSFALSKLADVRFVSFGRRASRERLGERYERVVLESWTSRLMTPFSPRLLQELSGADVIHCHQYFVLPTFLACLAGRLRGSAVFVTDLGGGDWTPGYQVDQSRWIKAHLPLSAYAARELPGRNKTARVVPGGVDIARHAMREALVHDGSVVFLGRVLPHKGVHFLIEGLPADRTLHVVGPAPDRDYRKRLAALVAGRDVRFHEGLADSEVVALLQRAQVLVHPTPVDDHGSAGVHELFGLALVEAMACGCPVIASDVASLPEIVVHGETGMLVPPNAPAALGAAIREIGRDEARWRELSVAARKRVETHFTWDHAARACLRAYEELR